MTDEDIKREIAARGPCMCADPRPLVPGAVCRRCRRFTVVNMTPGKNYGRVISADPQHNRPKPEAAARPTSLCRYSRLAGHPLQTSTQKTARSNRVSDVPRGTAGACSA